MNQSAKVAVAALHLRGMGNNMPMTPRIFLADLTHVGESLSSNVFPLGVGLVGACLKENLETKVEVELFKYPGDLAQRVEESVPTLVGFSNYSWNCNISYDYARKIKERHPEVIVIFGGPNYGLTKRETELFWQRYPLIDFYIVKEGELATLALVEKLAELDFNTELLKSSMPELPNCHYWWAGEIQQGPELSRIRDLNHIPSPYLMGMMDKFFDGNLAPLVHTTRGCPFACTFCSEGATYYNKVAQRTELADELAYIAARINNVPDLFLSDANFGMYREDKGKAEVIADVQAKHGWPKRLVVSTGKNRKERILEVSSLLSGALKITASLQSTDDTILENIKRSNIATDALTEIADQSSESSSGTYSELILGLPGDCVEAHTNSLRDVIDSHMGMVRMYQLIMLPQTELNTPESRAKHDMKTKFRPMPRSFGQYKIFGGNFFSLEWEEICVANNTLSFADYLECRQLDLSVEILHNTGIFLLLQRLCRYLNLSWFNFIQYFHESRDSHPSALSQIYDVFICDSQSCLWDDVDEMKTFFQLDKASTSTDVKSTNEMANAKAAAVFKFHALLHETVFKMFSEFSSEVISRESTLDKFINELADFNFLRTKDVLVFDDVYERTFSFDFSLALERQGPLSPQDYLLPTPSRFKFFHYAEKAALISEYTQQYGISEDGLTRIVMRAPLNELYRDAIRL